MSIKCAHCKGRHGSVADVKACAHATQSPTRTHPTPTPAYRPNKFPGDCATCTHLVPEGAGRIEKVGDRWAVYHLTGQCSPTPAPGTPAAAPRTPFPDVPAGHYATASRTGHNDLDFWRVDRPTEGSWRGRTFVKRVIGGRPSQRVRGGEMVAALKAILEAGPAKAGELYGREIGRCYHCNRHLTDDLSRQRGVGPDCWVNHGHAG